MSPRIRSLKHATTSDTTATAPATPTATPPGTSSTTAPPAAAAIPASLAAPPPDAKIPAPPEGFEPTNGAHFRGTQPRKTELVALPLAIEDLQGLPNYQAIFGLTAPPLDEVLEIFGVANQWSTMRNASSSWDAYCRDQEGISWVAMRAVMDRLKPAFDLAQQANPSLKTKSRGLASLLNAKTVSANKAVATKKKNKQDVADGKSPSHGNVGKTQQKNAAKAALAEKTAAEAASTAHAAPAPTTTPTTPTTEAAPAPAPAPTNGGTNGTPHT